MNDFQIFTYRNEQVRTIQQPDGLWWVLRDVCQILRLSNPTVVASRLEDDERTKFNLGRQGEATIINEPGLYAVILRSDKPEAKDFKRWVTHEVLPSIRKNGGYIAGQENMSDAELMAKALEVARRTLANKQVQIEHMQPKAVFADAVCASNTTILVGELAKILRQNGVDMGEKRKTSAPCWKNWQKSKKLAFQSLDLRVESGQKRDISPEMDGALRGELSMPNFGESPSDAVESRLSWILEDNVPEKYYLSVRACQGILNRASRRGKELPEILRKALLDMIEWWKKKENA